MGRVRRAVKPVALAGVIGLGLLQLVPYGWRHSNPPVTGAAVWPSAEAERLARAACYDCHSNETEWPVYSYVAPMSWLVRYDVDRGRDALNFSVGGGDDLDDAAEEVEDRSMPPDRYVRLHPDARLSAAERAGPDRGPGGHGRGRRRGRRREPRPRRRGATAAPART